MSRFFSTALALLFLSSAGAANISIQLAGGAFRVAGWSPGAEPAAGWSSVFSLTAGKEAPQFLLGSYAVERGELVFHPRFPVSPGVPVLAVFLIAGGERVETVFETPAPVAKPLTRVARIYPSADILPENTLRFYIFFSAPMSRGEAWEHIRLLEAETGTPVDIPFLELEQELWDRTNQRLTIFFDPGRIKRGLVPTESIGSPVVSGKRYRLAIDSGWRDARGVPLAAGFEKTFQGVPADRVIPTPKNWRVTAPRAGGRGPLVITFVKPMDYVLLQRTIGIFDGQREISGKIEVMRNEMEWRFTPLAPWKAGSYRITADNILEDISGNHLDRLFDVDVFEKVTERIVSEATSLSFTVR